MGAVRHVMRKRATDKGMHRECMGALSGGSGHPGPPPSHAQAVLPCAFTTFPHLVPGCSAGSGTRNYTGLLSGGGIGSDPVFSKWVWTRGRGVPLVWAKCRPVG